jgi:tetratricopeptide (TPR) repeat protein
VDLHVGVGYARLAREEYAWARRSFEEALVLDPEHEDALAGLGETLLRFNQRDAALRCFRLVLEFGYDEDVDLMLQCGRALFRDGLVVEAREFFEVALARAPRQAEAVALLGYCEHRLGEDERAIETLRRALALNDHHGEARVYLANILYDKGAYEEALRELERTSPEEHWDELGVWRYLEMMGTMRHVADDDPDLRPWHERLLELNGEPDSIDSMLEEIEQRAAQAAEHEARGQLELFGAMLAELTRSPEPAQHRVVFGDGREVGGTWEEIVQQMRSERGARGGRTIQEFMQTEARRVSAQTGRPIPASDAESFIRATADAGLLRILD